MGRFKENNSEKFNDTNNSKSNFSREEDDVNIDDLNSYKDLAKEQSKEKYEDQTYKVLEKEEKDQYINSPMKKFRIITGAICLVLFIAVSFMNKINKNYMDNLTSGIIENINIGDVLTEDALKLDAKDASIEISGGYGNLEISIWNFAQKEDNDYVQVFIDGVEEGPPFSIRHKARKISVPDKSVITVQGIRDGSNNGITYAVHFNKTGETYLNTVPLNGTNTYTIISR